MRALPTLNPSLLKLDAPTPHCAGKINLERKENRGVRNILASRLHGSKTQTPATVTFAALQEAPMLPTLFEQLGSKIDLC